MNSKLTAFAITVFIVEALAYAVVIGSSSVAISEHRGELVLYHSHI